jgi:hypothetical protein
VDEVDFQFRSRLLADPILEYVIPRLFRPTLIRIYTLIMFPALYCLCIDPQDRGNTRFRSDAGE